MLVHGSELRRSRSHSGCTFVGVEIDAAYFATACDRISAAYLAGGGSPDEINDAAA